MLAPTGTIGLMMDCDTTGIEPDLGLCKIKKLVGGGTMTIVNQTVPRALRRLGYTAEQIAEIVAYIDEHKTILGAPHLAAEHVAGVRLLDGRQHHPLLGPREDDGGGAAVHLRRHLQDGQHARGGHGRGGRAAPHRRLAAGRQGRRHLPRQLQGRPAAVHGQEGGGEEEPPRVCVAAGAEPQVVERIVEQVVEKVIKVPVREKLPRNRTSRTFEFRVADCKGFVTVGEYEDGRPGEIFIRISKQGSTLAGDHGRLRHLGELRPPVRRAAAGLRRDVHQHALRAGRHDRRSRHPDRASSLVDYIFRRLAVEYLSLEERAELGILTIDERMQPTLPGRGGDGHRDAGRAPTSRPTRPASTPARPLLSAADAPQRAQPARAGRGHRSRAGEAARGHPAQGQPQRRPLLHAVRRPDAAGRLLPRLPQLRQHQRLQLIPTG